MASSTQAEEWVAAEWAAAGFNNILYLFYLCVCMYACVCVRLCVCMCVGVCACVCVFLCARVFVRMFIVVYAICV